ncbi:MAG: TrmH family RNA methyltransferase [Patescibacteria group bacterium]
MKDMVVVLHNIRSLHNVGSIFRTADAASVCKIYLCGITPTPLDRFNKPRGQFTKVSLGAEKSVTYEKISKTTIIIKKLREAGYKIFAVEQSKKSKEYFRFQKAAKKQKIAVILGNEVRGLPPAILKLADKILEIPMAGKKESLNVAVAFGIVIYRLIY